MNCSASSDAATTEFPWVALPEFTEYSVEYCMACTIALIVVMLAGEYGRRRNEPETR